MSILPAEADSLVFARAPVFTEPTFHRFLTLLRLMPRWFPDRSFVFVGDSGYGAHEVARFAHRRRDRLTPVSKLHPDANLFEPPPPYTDKGRPRAKGARLPKPRQAVEQTRRLRRRTVSWYGGGRRSRDKAGVMEDES